MMAHYTFQSYPYSVRKVFTCAHCGKPKRTRTFTAECTLNPWNTEATTPAEVRQQSKRRATEAADRFMVEPWCSSCEGELSWKDREDLRARRSAPKEQQP